MPYAGVDVVIEAGIGPGGACVEAFAVVGCGADDSVGGFATAVTEFFKESVGGGWEDGAEE